MVIDYKAFKFINDFAGKIGFFDQIGIIFAKYLIIVLLLFGLIVFFRFKNKIISRIIILNCSLSVFLGLIINYFISLIYFRPRPFVSHLTHQLINKSALDKSFPSNHTTVSFAIAFTLYFYDKKIGIAAFIIAFLIGLARIYVGVHYPLDILAGLFVGFLSALLIYILLKKKIKKTYGKTN